MGTEPPHREGLEPHSPPPAGPADLAGVLPRRLFLWFMDAPTLHVLLVAALLSAVILWLDIVVHAEISTGILYIIPSLILGLRLDSPKMLAISLLFAVLREHFGSSPWEPEWQGRLAYGLLSFTGASLFSGEFAKNRRRAVEHERELREHIRHRVDAETQLKALIESSPAAIITLDTSGRVLLANLAAEELFRLPAGSLLGADIAPFLPVLRGVLDSSSGSQPYRTATNCRARRANGESFLAYVWFATYETRTGKRLAAIITDSSEDLREWQETSLQSLLRSTRVLVGSVSHEIRNICAAISLVHANLGRLPGVASTEDYAALGTLAQALARLATVELHSSNESDLELVSVPRLLEEFRIVVAPAVEAAEVDFSLSVADDLPAVFGDHHGLLQVLMNLFRNSLRALEDCAVRRVEVSAVQEGAVVLIRVRDSGPGVVRPDRLFQPFQQGADAVGLGLFVSRAIVRAGGGELYHEPHSSGCSMCLKLKLGSETDLVSELSLTEIPQ